ncbi:toll-like receptor 7 isoform X2 [Haemaphysalis longicornis]
MRPATQLLLTSLVLTAFLGQHPCAAESTRGCPSLDLCLCKTTRHGPRVLCTAISDAGKLSAKFSQLAGLVVDSLMLDGVNITALPPRYFENLTVKALYVKNTPLQSTERDSFKGAKILTTLYMGHNQLRTIPDGLEALSGLKELRLPNNYIRSTDNLPPLRSVTDLDLSGNLIEKLNNTVLRTFTSLRKVWLGNNLISYLSPYFFKNVSRLELVDLHNNFITNIYYSFQGLHLLTELNLSHNTIGGIVKLATGTTPRLKVLLANNNRISWIPRFGFHNTEIETLDLQKCNISELRSHCFTSLHELRSLDLSYNVIPYIPGNSFSRQSGLKYFNAAGNRLRSIDGTFIFTSRMEKLNLSMNLIEEIGEALINMTSLKMLTLRNNRIQFIQDGTFRSNFLVQHLDLSGNRLEWLGKYCFKRLFSLKVLLITENSITSLNGSIGHLPSLRYLFIHNNKLTALRATDFEDSPQLTSIYAYGNNITNVRGAFKSLDRLEVLMLQKNRLRSVHRQSLPRRLDKLRKLVLNGNPLFCDCQLSWLVNGSVSLIAKGDPICRGPSWHRGKPLFNMTQDDLVPWIANCSKSCTCACHPRIEFTAAIFVNCSRRGLRELPEKFPWLSYSLDLSGNLLRKLDDRLVQKTHRLVSLYAADNLLSDIDTATIPDSTSVLDVRKNRLRAFPLKLVSDRNISSIWLSGNPWACSCEDYAFRQWAQANDDVIRDYNETACEEGPNVLTSKKKFMDLGQKELCPSRTVFMLLLFGIPFLLLLIAALAAATAYLKYKHEVRVWLYARGICRSLQCIKEDDVDEEKDFDVFVSFSNKDRDLVYAELLPKVEQHGFSVCTFDRNFKGGFLIQDIIQDAVACSRRTLLVLTHFLVR